MILKKIHEKSYYIPFIMIIVLIVMSTLYLNAILTNRLQNTIYIDIMSLLWGVLFFCILAICIILPIDILFLLRRIIKFIQETIIQMTMPIDITLMNNILMDIISMNTISTDATLMNAISIDTTPTETTPIETTPMYIMTEITPTDTTPLETIDNNINNTYIKVDSTNKDNFLGNKNKNKEKNKFDIAEKYIIEAFTGHCSEEGKKNICAVMKDYSNGETDFSNYSSISVKNLKPLDLYHFGWNIWNHFKDENRRKQVIIAVLLKAIFPEKLSNNSINTIVSHLKSHKEKGKIKIKEDLSKPDK